MLWLYCRGGSISIELNFSTFERYSISYMCKNYSDKSPGPCASTSKCAKTTSVKERVKDCNSICKVKYNVTSILKKAEIYIVKYL